MDTNFVVVVPKEAGRSIMASYYILYKGDPEFVYLDAPVKKGSDETMGEALTSPSLEPLEALVLNEQRAKLRELLDQLPFDDREIVLRHYQDLDTEEQIAKDLRIPRIRVAKTIHRVIAWLRQELMHSSEN